MSKNSEKKNESTFRRLFSYMGPYKGRMIISIILILLSAIANSVAPLMMGFSIDKLGLVFAGNQEAIDLFIAFLVLMVICYAIHSIFVAIGTTLIVSATEGTIYGFRKMIDDKISKLPLNYYDTNTYGDILSRVTNDVDTIAVSLQSSVYQVLNAIFTIIITVAMMIAISGWLTFIGLVSVPFVLALVSKIAGKSQVEFDKQQQFTGKLNGCVEEYYSGHNVVTVFGKEQDVINDFEKVNGKLFNAAKNGQFLSGILMPITLSMTNFNTALVSLVGALVAISGGLTIGMIQAFVQYLNNFSTPITQVLSITGIIQSTKAAADRIFEFLDEKEEVADVENVKFPEKLQGAVEFDHVRFGYLPHQTLIHDLNIKIGAGQKTAIVGPTGAGKTTLVNLIMRFYDVKGGAIRIDGVDIREMERARLREIFGMVLQETWLYSGTIMENIRYGKLDATDEDVINACKAARADTFIQTLPGGYNFVLHEGASNIAQGQRQLLTIARAILSDPPIMILDEATSSVDTRTEVLIQEAMAEMMKGRTSFVIAHRLSTIKDSNNILYMQDGDILEVGNHEELMAKDGLYAKLYNSQFSDQNG